MRALSAFVTAMLIAGCGLDVALFGGALGKDHEPPPDAAVAPEPLMQGTASGLSGATVSLVDANGASALDTTVTSSGTFSFTLKRQTAYRNLRAVVKKGQLALLAFAPSVSATTPGQSTPPISSVGAVDDLSTMAALVVSEKLRQSGQSLAATQPSVISQAVTLVKNMASADGPVKTFWRMVVDLKAAADTTKSDVDVFNLAALASTTYTSFLNRTFLLAKDVDYTRDTNPDRTTDAFDLALADAARAFTLPAPVLCLDPTKIRVVFTVNMNAGQKDGNCDTIDRFLWAQDDPGDTMFFTGAVHEESPVQDPAVSEMLGNFRPNQVAMVDDGTRGDAVAGDGIWTVTFDLPWNPACQTASDAGAVTDAGAGADAGATLPCLRLGYKYTWGRQGAGWTSTEEFPGNRHILEVFDVNGDGIVHRADSFADETTNKDKANSRRPAKGGTGVVTWTTDADGDGVFDAREEKVDTDNDCKPDAWPPPPAVEPITVTCP